MWTLCELIRGIFGEAASVEVEWPIREEPREEAGSYENDFVELRSEQRSHKAASKSPSKGTSKAQIPAPEARESTSREEAIQRENEIIYLQDELAFLRQKVRIVEEAKEQLERQIQDSKRGLSRGPQKA